MSLSRGFTIVVMAAFTGGCGYDFDYQYIEIPRGFEIVEHGRTQVNNVRNHSDMPVRYRLEREAYILHAQIDIQSIPPIIVFSVEGKTLVDAHLQSAGVPCFLLDYKIFPHEYESRGYDEGSIRLIWRPKDDGPCQGSVLPDVESRTIEISVVDGVGTVVATETVHFDIVTNGIYREFDGP